MFRGLRPSPREDRKSNFWKQEIISSVCVCVCVCVLGRSRTTRGREGERNSTTPTTKCVVVWCLEEINKRERKTTPPHHHPPSHHHHHPHHPHSTGTSFDSAYLSSQRTRTVRIQPQPRPCVTSHIRSSTVPSTPSRATSTYHRRSMKSRTGGRVSGGPPLATLSLTSSWGWM